MLSLLARSALRASAPAATASRTTLTLPILSSRAYSAISEALEHPDASSIASTAADREHTQSLKKDALANQKKKDKAKALKLRVMEREREKAKKEREKARKEREKASVKAKKESEKAKKEREKASVKAKEQKEIDEPVVGMLNVPKGLPAHPYAIYMSENSGNGGGRSFLTETVKKWQAESEAVKEVGFMPCLPMVNANGNRNTEPSLRPTRALTWPRWRNSSLAISPLKSISTTRLCVVYRL